MTEDQRTNIRETTQADRKHISKMLAAAFHDDPVLAYIYPDAAVRKARLPKFFDIIYNGDLSNGVGYMTLGGEAATLWRAPGHGHLSLREKVVEALPWARAAGFALGRALKASAASDANHPTVPHWYLHFAGCSPEEQGRGFGGMAIKAGLARADAEGYPCYLETAKETNLPLYEKLGFKVTHEWQVIGGPVNWSMYRTAYPDE
jgi:ribosomal protein S18 acetylase RimI-like enzyme